MDDQPKKEPSREETIEQLSGAGYGPREIAIYLNEDVKAFLEQWKDPGSDIRYYYDRGILLTEGKMSMAIAEAAAGGNITAAQQHIKINGLREFQNVRHKLLTGEL